MDGYHKGGDQYWLLGYTFFRKARLKQPLSACTLGVVEAGKTCLNGGPQNSDNNNERGIGQRSKRRCSNLLRWLIYLIDLVVDNLTK